MNDLELLQRLIDQKYGGNQAAFARAIGRQPAQVNQYLKGRRATLRSTAMPPSLESSSGSGCRSESRQHFGSQLPGTPGRHKSPGGRTAGRHEKQCGWGQKQHHHVGSQRHLAGSTLACHAQKIRTLMRRLLRQALPWAYLTAAVLSGLLLLLE